MSTQFGTDYCFYSVAETIIFPPAKEIKWKNYLPRFRPVILTGKPRRYGPMTRSRAMTSDTADELTAKYYQLRESVWGKPEVVRDGLRIWFAARAQMKLW